MARSFRPKEPAVAGTPRGAGIPPMDHDEAAALGTVELARLLNLLKSLQADEWYRPTICAGWTVKDLAAHLCGLASLYAHAPSLRQFRRLLKYRDRGFLDGLNQSEVDARAEKSPAELIQELAADGPVSIRTRHRLPAIARGMPILIPIPGGGVRPLGYLTDVLNTRDFWMHRLDLARAVDREFEVSADHDGRIVALIVRDLSEVLPRRIGPERTVRLDLTSPAGGTWDLGAGTDPRVTLRLDALDFAWLSANRTDARSLVESGQVLYEGEKATGWQVLNHCQVMF